MAGPATQHRFRERAQVAELAATERRRRSSPPFALGPTVGVERRPELAAGAAVHHDECRPLGDGDLMDVERGEIDGEGVPGVGAEDGQGSSSPTREPAASSALWQEVASSSRSWSSPRASRKATEKAALDERPAPTGMVLVTFTAPPEGGRASARRAAARTAWGGEGAVLPRGNLPRLGVLVAGHPDQEAAQLGGEAGLGGQVDGHGEREALVVVGVVADEGDPSRSTSDEHCASLTPAGHSGHDPAMAQTPRSGPLNGIKIIELAGIGPSPYTAMMLADAGAQVIRLERAAPGAPERASEGRDRTGTFSIGAGCRWGST